MNKSELEDRLISFSVLIIELVNEMPNSKAGNHLSGQIVRSGTSVSLNYGEAQSAESKKDFIHKIGICKKEAKEGTHWLHMIAVANPDKKEKCRELWQEAHELTLIFSAIAKKR